MRDMQADFNYMAAMAEKLVLHAVCLTERVGQSSTGWDLLYPHKD